MRLAYRQGTPIVLRAETKQPRHGSLRPFDCCWIISRICAKAASQHVRIDDARIQWDGRHALGKFLGQRLGESLHGPLGRTVGGDSRIGGATPAGTEIDDNPAFPAYHGRREMPDEIGHALDIHVDDG